MTTPDVDARRFSGMCPIDSRHGRLVDAREWSAYAREHPWWCGHSDHGGNGRFFTEAEAYGDLEVSEDDVMKTYSDAARNVIAGKITVDLAVREIARGTKISPTTVREQLNTMIGVVRGNQEERETMAKARAAAATKAPAAPPPPKAARKKLEHVPGERFEALRIELGLSAKETAEATGAAHENIPGAKKMGASSTYIYILTHDGASSVLFDRYEAALRAYVANRPEFAQIAPEVADDEDEDEPYNDEAADARSAADAKAADEAGDADDDDAADTSDEVAPPAFA